MEAIHVELTNKTIDVPMPKIFGEDAVLKVIDILDGELSAIGHPVNYRLVFFVLEYFKTFLNEVSHRIL